MVFEQLDFQELINGVKLQPQRGVLNMSNKLPTPTNLPLLNGIPPMTGEPLELSLETVKKEMWDIAQGLCSNEKGLQSRVTALKHLHDSLSSPNPFDDDITIEERVTLLKRLLTLDDILSIIKVLPVAEKKQIKKIVAEMQL